MLRLTNENEKHGIFKRKCQMKRTVGWDNGFLLLPGSCCKGTASAFTTDRGDALSQEVMKIAPFITGGQQTSCTLALCFSLSPWDRCHRGWGQILAGGCVLELRRVWGWNTKWKVRGMQVALGPKRLSQTEDNECRVEQKKPRQCWKQGQVSFVYLPQTYKGDLRAVP